jgi:putative endonuclease
VKTREVGRLGERIAEWFLALKGFEVVGRNLVYAGREIDLLVRRGPLLVAVEVKLRRGAGFGRAVEAVDRRKLSRIEQALACAVAREERPVVPRIDLVVIDFDAGSDRMIVEHIESVV